MSSKYSLDLAVWLVDICTVEKEKNKKMMMNDEFRVIVDCGQ